MPISDKIIHLKILVQPKSEKNIQLETQVARLEPTINKIQYQSHQKNIHKTDLYKTVLAQKKEQKALAESNW